MIHAPDNDVYAGMARAIAVQLAQEAQAQETLIRQAMRFWNCSVDDLVLEIDRDQRTTRVRRRDAGWRWLDWQSANHGWVR